MSLQILQQSMNHELRRRMATGAGKAKPHYRYMFL
jgi:hypothetical protein